METISNFVWGICVGAFATVVLLAIVSNCVPYTNIVESEKRINPEMEISIKDSNTIDTTFIYKYEINK